MGGTINIGVGMGAYVFTDRATWSSFKGQAFIDWVVSGEGQANIRSFQINGEQQFFPNGGPTG